jgi:hypothetical protein
MESKVRPRLAVPSSNVGAASPKLGDTRKGLVYKEQALEMFKELYGEKAQP